MSFPSTWLTWANAPFLVALGVAVLFALLQMSGLLGLLAGGGEHGDHDGDAEADGDHDADADADGDADADEPGLGQQLLAGLGVGRVPLSIVWQTYAISFGVAGLVANAIYLGAVGALPLRTLAWTLPLALGFGYLTTRLASALLARIVADPRQEATSRRQLVGHTGVVISSKVSDEFGEVRLRDKTGHVVRLICRTRAAEAAIAEGREVVVVDYDEGEDRLYVAPLDDEAPPGHAPAP